MGTWNFHSKASRFPGVADEQPANEFCLKVSAEWAMSWLLPCRGSILADNRARHSLVGNGLLSRESYSGPHPAH